MGTTYYNNPENVLEFINHHSDYVDELIIVDDGSESIYTITNYIQPSEKIKLYRVKKDYGFNSHGCRNLIMKKAANEFVILLDSDRILVDPAFALYTIKKKNLRYDTLYHFTAHVLEFGNSVHNSVNDFLISKNFFFSAGGYDEEWIGFRSGDRQYFEQLKNFGKEELIPEIDIILTRTASKSTNQNRLLSKNDISTLDPKLYNKVMNRIQMPDPDKKILTFEWEQII